MESRRRGIKGLIVGLLVLFVCGISTWAEETVDFKIEQVSVNMPDVTAYYRLTKQDDTMEAYLGGEHLSVESNRKFSETGRSVEYYVMIDISASITDTRFSEIKTSLIKFRNSLREGDKLVLQTFGDTATIVLNGEETAKDAETIINSLDNNNQNTVLFDGIDQMTKLIWQKPGDTSIRRVIAIISDGKDCADNTRNMDSVEKQLISKGIPVYTIAVENNQGDTETEIASYQGQFAALARNTGGLPWNAIQNNGVINGLQSMQSSIMDSFCVDLKADSNVVSNQNEDFMLEFPNENGISDTCSILVSKGQADSIAPEVIDVQMGGENQLDIYYSESVKNADNIANYEVKKSGKVLGIKQVVKKEDDNSCISLIFDKALVNGEYKIVISNVTDCANEKNALKSGKIAYTMKDGKKQNLLQEFFQKWWPLLLGLVLLLAGVLFFVIRSRKKQETEEALSQGHGEDVLFANGVVGTDKKHIKMKSQLPTKQVALWLSNGNDAPKRMDLLISGSAIVGRSEDCDVYCDDPMMSRQHFAFEVKDGKLFVQDLQSQNGTVVNGIKISDAYCLQPNDEIIAGNIRFRIQDGV